MSQQPWWYLTVTPKAALLRAGRLTLLCLFSVGLTVFEAVKLQQLPMLIVFAVIAVLTGSVAALFWTSYLLRRKSDNSRT